MSNYNLSSYDVFRDLNYTIITNIAEQVRANFQPYLERRCWTLVFYGLPDMHSSEFTESLT